MWLEAVCGVCESSAARCVPGGEVTQACHACERACVRAASHHDGVKVQPDEHRVDGQLQQDGVERSAEPLGAAAEDLWREPHVRHAEQLVAVGTDEVKTRRQLQSGI